MSEPLRILSPHILFHVISRGNAQQVVFRDENDFHLYLELLQHYKKKCSIHVYHFVLMSNHIHLLIEPTKENTLSKFMVGINLTYAKYFNKKYNMIGHVWKNRFRAIPIEVDEYYFRCARYIELNPVRANIVSHPLDYPWSSFSQSIQASSNIWTDTHPLMADLQKPARSGQKGGFQTYVESQIENSKHHRTETFARLSAYGSAPFINQLQK